MSNLALSYADLGRHAEVLKLNEETLALRKAKLGLGHPDTLMSMHNLAESYVATGRTSEALSLWEKCSSARPKDTLLILKVAALQAWNCKDKDFAATRRRTLALAEGTNDVSLAERAAKASSILPSSERAELEAALALGRKAVELGKVAGGDLQPWNLLALGMAAYRAGDDSACDEPLLAAEDGKNNRHVRGTSAFYRAMSLHRRGKLDEARKLATEAAATMRPLPADGQYPLAGGASHDDLILWLAYKEAKAMIGLADPPAAPAQPAGK
jgi:tetratricopeptide (TPR) repeat protein